MFVERVRELAELSCGSWTCCGVEPCRGGPVLRICCVFVNRSKEPFAVWRRSSHEKKWAA